MKVMNILDRPLHGITVLDFSQFLSGPFASLRLADYGARVIKIERPRIGDICRHLYISDVTIDGDNSLFHAINRNKESFTADLKTPEDREVVKQILEQADVMIQNFRPGVIEKSGFGYDDVKAINPRIIYGSISGYGTEGNWKDLPGQDLLAQARSGLLWLTGSRDDPPVPMGLAVADILAGSALAQGILAALVGRSVHGKGALIETSLLEVLVDLQFEVLTTHLNDGRRPPVRSALNGAHAYLGAPYGVYKTRDGYIAIAMIPSLEKFAELLCIKELEPYYADKEALIKKRDEIKAIIAEQLSKKATSELLSVLQPADIWCSEVLDWKELFESPSFKELDFLQSLDLGPGSTIGSVRGPVRFNGQVLKSSRPAPKLGAGREKIIRDLIDSRQTNRVAN